MSGLLNDIKMGAQKESQLLTGMEHMSSGPCPVTTEFMAEYVEG
jgi:hypothetical protein